MGVIAKDSLSWEIREHKQLGKSLIYSFRFTWDHDAVVVIAALSCCLAVYGTWFDMQGIDGSVLSNLHSF